MKTVLVLVTAIVAQAFGDVFLTKGMKTIVALDGGAPTYLSGAWHIATEAIGSPMIWAGTLLLIVFFALFSAALSWADLSFVLPATAFGYVLNVAAGHFFLGERVSATRWAGAVVITMGVLFVSRSARGTTDVPREHSHARGAAQ
jgi:drug/metabolite transporter (DMT)-like permease